MKHLLFSACSKCHFGLRVAAQLSNMDCIVDILEKKYALALTPAPYRPLNTPPGQKKDGLKLFYFSCVLILFHLP